MNQSHSGGAIGYLSLDKGTTPQRVCHMTDIGFSQPNFLMNKPKSSAVTNRGIKSAGNFNLGGLRPPMHPNSSRPATNGDPRARHRDQI